MKMEDETMSESTAQEEKREGKVTKRGGEITIAIGPRAIPPGVVVTSRMDFADAPTMPGGEVFVPVAVELDPDCADHFEVLFASRGDEVLLSGERSTRRVDGVDVPARIGHRVDLQISPGAEGPLLVVVRNRSLDTSVLRASLVGESLPRAESASSVEGLLEKCWRWFREGIAAAQEDLARARSGGEEGAGVVDERPERCPEPAPRGSLRRLAGLALEYSVLPLELALARLVGDDETVSQETMLVLGCGPVPPGASARAATKVLLPMRLVGMCVDARCAEHFDVESLRVGKNDQLLAPTPLPARLFANGEMPVGSGEVALLDQEISISVHNHDSEPRDFEAVLVGVFQAPRGRR